MSLSRYYAKAGIPKPASRASAKRQKARQEAKVIREVRAACMERDGHCRYQRDLFVVDCAGRSEWAHVGMHRRFKTRGMAPTCRHTTANSLMLCTKHHREYDARRLWIRYLSDTGCDGILMFIEDK